MIRVRYAGGKRFWRRELLMTMRQAEMLLAAVVAVRATSFLFSKVLLADMGPFSLLGLRFLLAFAVLALLFNRSLRRASHRALAAGCVLGAIFFTTMSLELHALASAPSSTVSLLENLAIVLVPLTVALWARKWPGWPMVLAAVTAMAGVAMLAAARGGVSAFGIGEMLALVAALSYTASIIATAYFAREGDGLAIGIVEIGVMGALGMGAALLFEQPTLPATAEQWGALAVLVAVCTGFGFTLQPVAQRYLPAEQAGLFCAITPLVAGALGIAVLGEPCDVATLVGMGLIVAAMAEASCSTHGSPQSRKSVRSAFSCRVRTERGARGCGAVVESCAIRVWKAVRALCAKVPHLPAAPAPWV